MGYREEWNKIGYNLEELYFEKLNRELIRKLRAGNPEQAAQMSEKDQPMGVVLQFRAKTVTEAPKDTERPAEVLPLRKTA
jgi:hypothetical protein